MEKVSLSARTAVNLTATGTIAGNNKLIGFYVNSTTAGTLTLADGASAITGTITPAIGFHWFPYEFNTSCVVTIANTMNATMLFA